MCKTEEGVKRVEKVRAQEEKYMVAVREKEEAKKRAAAEELKTDKEKTKKQVEAGDVVDAVLGGGNAAVMAEVLGQGGPSSSSRSAAASAAADVQMENKVEEPTVTLSASSRTKWGVCRRCARSECVRDSDANAGGGHRRSEDPSAISVTRPYDLQRCRQWCYGG